MSRVVTGGHNIDANEITFNLEEGIKRVNVDLGLYDRIQFVDTSIKYAPVRFAHYLKSCDKISISSEHIKWFNENFRGPIIKLHNERITASQKPRKTARQKRGRRP
jgi:predicted ABC-type ATPase